MNVLIAEGMHEDGLTFLNANRLNVFDRLNDKFNMNEIDVLIIRSVFEVNAKSLKGFPRLKLVAKLGTGLDNINIDDCQKKGIKVISAPGMNAISTAEFSVIQALNIVKRGYTIYTRVKTNDLRRSSYYGHELSSKIAGIIGYGNVGKNIAEMIKPFVSKVYIYEKTRKNEVVDEKLHFVSSLDKLLISADIIMLAVTLPGNERMVNKEFLSKVKKDVLLVNTARGRLIDENSLIKFLEDNEESFYYCDVIYPEPDYTLSPDEQNYRHHLLNLANVLYTPHIAGMTDECQAKISVKIAQDILAFSKGELS